MKLIDLDEFLRQNCIDRIEGKSCEECKYHVLAVSCKRLMEQPTIDAVEVVRCQNCKHGYFAGTALYCDKQSRSHAWHKAAINWFCADGERREDG